MIFSVGTWLNILKSFHWERGVSCPTFYAYLTILPRFFWWYALSSFRSLLKESQMEATLFTNTLTPYKKHSFSLRAARVRKWSQCDRQIRNTIVDWQPFWQGAMGPAAIWNEGTVMQEARPSLGTGSGAWCHHACSMTPGVCFPKVQGGVLACTAYKKGERHRCWWKFWLPKVLLMYKHFTMITFEADVL